MSDETKDPELQTWIDPELEARVVAWVLGEASEFEAAELARIIAEKPELRVFQRRIETVHGLVAAASRLEIDPMRLAPERREKLLERLGAKNWEAAAVLAMPQEPAKARKPFWKSAVQIAACLAFLALLASITLPSYNSVRTRAVETELANMAAQKALAAEAAKDDQQAAQEIASAPAPSVSPIQLTQLNALKALASQQRDQDVADDFQAGQAGQWTAQKLAQAPQFREAGTLVSNPANSDRDEAVRQLAEEAKRNEQNGQFDRASRDYDRILNVDPYNVAARKGQEAANAARNGQSLEAYAETRSEVLWKTDNGWAMPDHKFGVREAENFSPAQTDVRHTEYIINKLNRIIIPKIEFRDATVREALDFLKEKSVQLDTEEPDPTRRGVNIVDEINPDGVMGQDASAAASTPSIPGLAAAPQSSPSGNNGEAHLTLALSNVPLGEALKYVASLANLKLKVDPYAVALVPPAVNTDELITKEYAVPPGFISSTQATGGNGTFHAPAGGGSGDASGAGAAIPTRQSVMDYLTANGVKFPPGANAEYFPATGKLIVHNTQPNLELADSLVEPVGVPAPQATAGSATNAQGETEPASPGLDEPALAAPVAAPAANGQVQAGAPGNPNAVYMQEEVSQNIGWGSGLGGGASAAPTGMIDSKDMANSLQPHARFNLGTQVATVDQDSNATGNMRALQNAGTMQFQAQQQRVPILGDIPAMGMAFKKAAKQQAAIPVQDEISASDQPFSTFSLHVSDVSFLLAQAELAQGQLPDRDSVRPEEFYNAFDYGDPAPGPGEQIACRIEQAAHPVFQQRNLVRIAMKVAATGRGAGQPLRLTVLLDTSGSMEREDRAASVQRAMRVLTSLLGPNDAITLIGFAREPRLLAEEVPGDQAGKLVDIVKRTPPQGGTNMEEALKLASQLALRHYQDGGQNRVVVLTDGAANLGDADPVQLSNIVANLRQKGVSFDACGVGANGLNDDILEALTRKGGGRYYFLNKPEDADAGFAQELAGAFRPAAENVKMQVRFNPDRVGKYRLIGFDKNRLNQEDFRNDQVTAAQLASEEAAVALYQVQVMPDGDGELGEVFVRFRDPADGRMVEQSWTIPYDPQTPELDKASPSMRLAATASLLAEKLRGGAVAEAIDLDALEPVVTQLRGEYSQQQRVQQLVAMFEQARRMTSQK